MSEILGGICVLTAMVALSGLKSVKEHDRMIVYRFGKLIAEKGPGLQFIVPMVDKGQMVDMRVATLPIPLIQATTSDNYSVRVSALCLYQIIDAKKAITRVFDLPKAVTELSELALRAEVGNHDLPHLISERKRVNFMLRANLDRTTKEFGIRITKFELKEVRMSKDMRKMLARSKTARLQHEHQQHRMTWKLDLDPIADPLKG